MLCPGYPSNIPKKYLTVKKLEYYDIPDRKITKPKIVNLSSRDLTKDEIDILTKGPKFCPSTPGSYLEVKADIAELTRKMKIFDTFSQNQQQEEESLVKLTSNREILTKNKSLQYIVDQVMHLEPQHINKEDNLSLRQKKALKDLQTDRKITIKKADKSNIFVVMDTDFYKDKLVLKDHLLQPTYELSPDASDKKVFKEVITLMKLYKDCLTNKEFKYITDYTWKSSNFYVQPKINKCQEIKKVITDSNCVYIKMAPPESLKGRPIISGPISPTKHLSQLIDKIIAPLVRLQKSYIKDDWDLIRKLPKTISYEAELFTCDIVSLYTSIPHDLGLKAMDYWITKERARIPQRFTKEYILKMIAFILKNNYFVFNEQMYHQLQGTGMGVDFAASYACLAIGYLEENYLFPSYLPTYYSSEDCILIQESYDRYMDDGFLIWPKYLDIKTFITALNSLDPNIKFTVDRGEYIDNKQIINMLDITIILHDSKVIETEIFYKETNTHDYLHYDSHHPHHIKNNIPYTLAKRIMIFTSNPEKEELRLTELKSWLLDCQYPVKVINKSFYNARLQGPAPDPSKKEKIIPLITSFYSNYTNKDVVKHTNMLLENCTDETIKLNFKNTRVVLAHKQPPNIQRLLTRAKFQSPDPQLLKPGLFKCQSKACKLCKLYIKECSSFITSNNKTWGIKCHITCNSINVLYFLKCLSCNGKTTYTGKTNNLRSRTNNHISSCRNGTGTNKLDNHIFKCRQGNNKDEPYFELYAFMTVKDENSLRSYENFLHKRGYDTLNKVM